MEIDNMTTELGKLLARSRAIYMITGAGISVSAGIPDFRSKDGLYNEIKERYPDKVCRGIDLFDGSFLYYNRHDSMIRQMYFSFLGLLKKKAIDAELTVTHKFIAQMALENRLRRIYTQNIDGLEEKAFKEIIDGKIPLLKEKVLKKLESKSIEYFNKDLDKDFISMPNEDITENIKINRKTKNKLKYNSYNMKSKIYDEKSNNLIQTKLWKKESALNKFTIKNNTLSYKFESQSDSGPLTKFVKIGEKPKIPNNISEKIIDRILYLHGNLSTLICTNCGYNTDMKKYLDEYIKGIGKFCPDCEERSKNRVISNRRPLKIGILTPQILLYNDRYNDGFTCGTRLDEKSIINTDLISSDIYNICNNRQYTKPMLLVIGTSCKVHGIKKLLRSFRTAFNKSNDRNNWPIGPEIIYINKTELPQKSWQSIFDIQLIGNCDEILQLIYNKMIL